jgi:Sugar (and other) transporter
MPLFCFIQFYSLGFYAISGILTIISPTEALTIGFGRMLAGIAHGCIYITAIVHAGEIAVKEMRGYLLASLHVSLYTGMFIYSVITANRSQNTIDPNRLTGIITLVYVIAGGFSYFFAHESPVFLIQRNRDGDAKQTMMQLRSETVETTTLNANFLELKAMVAEDERLSSSIFRDRNWRPLLIMTALRLLSVMAFNLPINFVRATFAVTQTGQHVSTLISGLRMVSGLVLLFTFDHLPRRKLFLPSAIPPCMSLLILSVS